MHLACSTRISSGYGVRVHFEKVFFRQVEYFFSSLFSSSTPKYVIVWSRRSLMICFMRFSDYLKDLYISVLRCFVFSKASASNASILSLAVYELLRILASLVCSFSTKCFIATSQAQYSCSQKLFRSDSTFISSFLRSSLLTCATMSKSFSSTSSMRYLSDSSFQSVPYYVSALIFFLTSIKDSVSSMSISVSIKDGSQSTLESSAEVLSGLWYGYRRASVSLRVNSGSIFNQFT